MTQSIRHFGKTIVSLRSNWPTKAMVEPEWDINSRVVYEDRNIIVTEIRDSATHHPIGKTVVHKKFVQMAEWG